MLIIDLCNEGDMQLNSQYVISQFRQVEVCVNQTWRTICAQGWTANNTGVVCRQLGISDPQGILKYIILSRPLLISVLMLCTRMMWVLLEVM